MSKKKARKIPEGFNDMRFVESVKAYQRCTEEEIMRMRRLREAGLSYGRIAGILGRAKITVMWHLKEEAWIEEQKEKNRKKAKDWYHSGAGKAWQHEAYERKKRLYAEGLLE